MRVSRSTAWAPSALAFAIVLASFGLVSLSGCDNGSKTEMAAPISPEMEKKTNEMLSGYGKMYNEKFRAAKTGKK